ncbi:MAG: efflux transporter outer membrane subunit [Bryobacteraceae bacterium]|nr:efflux transporter outer membrane subunit [Bryobacteraceae bacterium]
MSIRGILLGISLLALTTSCTVGPNYKRPAVPTPPQYRGPQPEAAADLKASVADHKFFDLFKDEALQATVDTALKNNFDLRIAAERIQQARAQYGIQRASLFPFVSGAVQWNATRASTLGSLPFISEDASLQFAYTQAGISVNWELDIWGRIRRLTEAARAQYLATEEARNAIRVSLTSDVASAWFQLHEQDLELAISRQTRDIAADGLRLTNLRRDRGVASGLDVRQAEQLLYTATSQITIAERNIGQTEDQLSFLLGQQPGPVTRGRPLEQVIPQVELPPGLPADLLARRPDIRQAEQTLIAANANIGAARAQYFPQIALTAFGGGQSRALMRLLDTPARLATINPQALIPIFRAGQVRNTVRLTEAQQREALVLYERTIFAALRDVSDALIAVDRIREQRSQQENLVKALADSSRLARLRYEGGLDSYLQVLDAQRNLFSGQLVLAQVRLLELQSVLRLYRSLGGGWQ